jgi:hypothetical protein
MLLAAGRQLVPGLYDSRVQAQAVKPGEYVRWVQDYKVLT